MGDGKGGIEMGGLVVGEAVGFPVFFSVGLGARRLADGAPAPGAPGATGDVDSVAPVRPVDWPAPGVVVTVPVSVTDGPPGIKPGWVIPTSTAMTAAAATSVAATTRPRRPDRDRPDVPFAGSNVE